MVCGHGTERQAEGFCIAQGSAQGGAKRAIQVRSMSARTAEPAAASRLLKLPPELQSEEREIREFLSGAGKPPELPNGGVVVTQIHPTVLREYWRREMAAIHRCRKFWADQKQSRESKQQ